MKKQGFILFYVLLLSAACTTLALLTWHGCLIQKKILYQLTQSAQRNTVLVQRVQEQEKKLYDQFSVESYPQVNFIPDTLTFGEALGVEYFELCSRQQMDQTFNTIHTIQGIRLR